MPCGDYVDIVTIALIGEYSDSLIGARIMDFNTGWNHFDNVDGGYIKYIEGWFVACKKETWDKLGGFDERYFPCDMEDIDLSYTADIMGIPIAELSIPVSHTSGATASKLGDRGAITKRNKKLFAEKWGLQYTI